jgi:hypothetical protein
MSTKISYNKAVFADQGEFTYQDAGKFSEHVIGMTIKFTKKNLAGDKRVTIIATPKDGEPITFSCTKPLSKTVREVIASGAKQTDVLGTLLNYDLKVDEEDNNKYFIFAPNNGGGEMLEGLTVTKKVVAEYEDAAF